jgi:hypothetical protein
VKTTPLARALYIYRNRLWSEGVLSNVMNACITSGVGYLSDCLLTVPSNGSSQPAGSLPQAIEVGRNAPGPLRPDRCR